MENTVCKDVILDKKFDDYGCNKDNFVASGELTVTITLGEYRKLVEQCATAQQRIDKANEDRYSRNSENESLKAENCRLKSELYELQRMAGLEEEVEEDK